MTRINITELATGKTIASQMIGFCSWDYIRECVAEWFSTPTNKLRPDDVHSIDDEDGNEFITVAGAPVARVDVVGETRTELLQAAE